MILGAATVGPPQPAKNPKPEPFPLRPLDPLEVDIGLKGDERLEFVEFSELWRSPGIGSPFALISTLRSRADGTRDIAGVA